MPNSQATDAFLASLDDQLERCGGGEPWRTEAIINLYGYHYTEPKTPFLAIGAMVLAGQIGILAPMWAVKLVDTAIKDVILRGSSLDIAFGVKGEGTGNTRGAEARKRLRKVMLEGLCSSVHRLVVGGLSRTTACKQVAQHVKALARAEGKQRDITLWFNERYSIKPPNGDTLLKQYRSWEKNHKSIEEIGAAVSETSREKDIEDFSSSTEKVLTLARCHLANPSQRLDEDTFRALKIFLDSLQPPSPNSRP